VWGGRHATGKKAKAHQQTNPTSKIHLALWPGTAPEPAAQAGRILLLLTLVCSWTMKPRDASMATRPWVSSDSRQRLTSCVGEWRGQCMQLLETWQAFGLGRLAGSSTLAAGRCRTAAACQTPQGHSLAVHRQLRARLRPGAGRREHAGLAAEAHIGGGVLAKAEGVKHVGERLADAGQGTRICTVSRGRQRHVSGQLSTGQLSGQQNNHHSIAARAALEAACTLCLLCASQGARLAHMPECDRVANWRFLEGRRSSLAMRAERF
jgi:hypothetical protein